MLSRGMRDKPIEISQGAPDSQRIAEPFPAPSPKVGGGEGTATRRVRHRTLPEVLYERHLEVGERVTGRT